MSVTRAPKSRIADLSERQFEHDCEISFEPAVGKCHFLGAGIDGDGIRYDFYIHAREKGVGLTELVARYGDEGGQYMSSAVEYLRLRPVGYSLSMAWDAAVEAGYDLAGMTKIEEHDLQVYEDRMADGGDPYAGTGIVDEGQDSIEP